MSAWNLYTEQRMSKRTTQTQLEDAKARLDDLEAHAHEEGRRKRAYEDAVIRFEALQQRYEALLRDHEYQQEMIHLRRFND